MAYPVSQLYVPGINGTLTNSLYNTEIQNILVQVGRPQNMDDFSSNVAQMQAQTDPGEVGSESQPVTLSEELERLRFAVKDVKQFIDPGISFWYQTPTTFSPSLLLTLVITNPSASDDLATITATNTAYTGNMINLRTNTTDSGSFNFIKCTTDIGGSPIDQFVVDEKGDMTCGVLTTSGLTVSGAGGLTVSGGGAVTIDGSLLLSQIAPIGSIIPFYDFNGAATFNATYWAYCDGSTATVGTLGSQTLPDLSGRYLVGFGTDGTGDLDSATFATAAVGNAGHTISLAHTHTVDSHSHTVNSHTHTGASHQHSINGNTGPVGNVNTGNLGGYGARINNNTFSSNANFQTDNNNQSSEGNHVHTLSILTNTTAGTTGSSSPGTSNSSPNTNSQLSAAQSIQPRSIRVRYIMRIL